MAEQITHTITARAGVSAAAAVRARASRWGWYRCSWGPLGSGESATPATLSVQAFCLFPAVAVVRL